MTNTLQINDWDEYFMRLAYLVAQKSKDPRTRIGSVLIRDRAIIATGYNGFPRLVNDSQERYFNRNLKLEMVCHSEANTITTSARLGISTDKTILYTFGVPCSGCTKTLIQGGISEIVCHKQWPNLTHSKEWVNSVELSHVMLEEARIPIRWLNKPLGIKGFLNGEFIEV